MTNQEIKTVGQTIAQETQIGGNTAERVGGVIEGIGEALDNKDAAVGYYLATMSGSTIYINASSYRLGTGGNLRAKMPAAATTACTLTVGNANAVQLWYNGAAVSADNSWEAGEIVTIFYDGTRFMASNSQGGGGQFGSGEKIKDVLLSQVLGAGTDAITSQKGVSDAIFNEIDISSIDTLKTLNDALAPSSSLKPTYYTVTAMLGSVKLKVGSMAVISDNMRHVVTEIMATHYLLDESGNLTNEHSDAEIFFIYRSVKLSGGTLPDPAGTWTKWRYVNSSVWSTVAEKIKYDNSQSGLAADDMQGALDEVVNFIPSQENSVTYPASVSGVEFGTNGNWVSQTSRALKFIPYTYNEGETLKITTGQYACSFAFLTSNSHVVGQPIPYCQGTTRSYVVANSTRTFVIPSDCLYICVYAAWTSTSVLPESMSIVSRHIITEEEVDEKIEVVDDKYSPLELGEIRGILLPSTIITGLQPTSANWQSNNNVRAYAVPYTYKEGDVFNAVGNVSQGLVAFLKSSDNIEQGQPIDYCNGERNGHYIPANQQISIPIPQDCRCIYIYATYGTGSKPTQLLPTNMYISNESIIDADEIKDAIDKTYFIHAGAPKLEWHHSGFIKADGTYGMMALNQFDVFKISGFVGNEDMALRYYAAGNVPSALIFDNTDTIIGTVAAPSSTTAAYRNVRVNLNDYPTAAYVLLNTCQYLEHLPIDLTPYSSFEERYPSYVEALKNELLEQITNKKSISIFFIGNSLTQDTVSYLPLILKEIAPDIEFKLYDWYNAGATLAQQYAKFTNNQTCETFSKCENVTSWTNYYNSVTINDILNNYDFDIVCLQEYSYFDFTESQLITNYNNIVSYISANYAKSLKYITLIDQPNRSKVPAMYAKSVSYAKTFLKSTVCEDILNGGGALFLALQTSLDSLGDQGHLSPDGIHSQEGLPCVLQAYVNALWILDRLSVPKSIYNSQTRITAENYPSINVPGPNLGTGVVEGTDEQYRIAQQCAIKAYKLSRKYVNEVLETLPETI